MGTIQRPAAELKPGQRVHIGHEDGATWRTVASVAPHPKYSAIFMLVTWEETPSEAPSWLASRYPFEVQA